MTVRKQVQKHVKTAFFHQDRLFFCQNRLQNRLRPGCTRHGDPAGESADPGLHEARRVCREVYQPCWRYFLCLVFASYSAKKVVLYLNDPVLSMVIFAYININIILSAI